MEREPFVDARTVAEYLSVGKTTVYDYAADGKIPSHRIGNVVRFRLSEIDQALTSTGKKGAA